MNHKKMQESGFTLVETIITMVIVAIMATMLFTFFGSKSFTGSTTPVQWVQNANSIHRVMERITADYLGYPRWKPGITYTAPTLGQPVGTTGSRVTPLSRNGYFYQPTVNCTSGTTEPPLGWSTTDGSISKENTGGCEWLLTYQTNRTLANPNPIMPLYELRRKIAGVSYAQAIADPNNLPANGKEGSTVTYDTTAATTEPMEYKIVYNRYISPGSTTASWDDKIDPTTWNVSPTQYLKVTIQRNDMEKLTVIFTEN